MLHSQDQPIYEIFINMKIIISESQFNTLNEQVLLGAGLGLMRPTAKVVTKYPHEFNAVASIATSFIPVVGPFISAGIGILDASMYYKEGDKTSAAISGLFSLIPFIGKIPGVKDAVPAVWKTIASKVSSAAKLTPFEAELVKQIAGNASSIQTLIVSASQKLSSVSKELARLKPVFVKKYGLEAYEKLMKDFITGVTDKTSFLQRLQVVTKPAM